MTENSYKFEERGQQGSEKQNTTISIIDKPRDIWHSPNIKELASSNTEANSGSGGDLGPPGLSKS